MQILRLRSCAAHGIQPQTPHAFCGDCGKLFNDENVDKCDACAGLLKTMCQKCHKRFTKKFGRVPVEKFKPS